MDQPREFHPGALARMADLIRTDEDEIGLLVDQRYEIVRRLGRGGMGEVFLADDRRMKRRVALKVLAAVVPGDRLIRRFEAEIRITARIEHPNIVPIYDFGSLPDERMYYTMRYVSGENLADRIRKGESRERLVEILECICEAVQYAHDRGVIHRDLKPANIMLEETGHVFVMDWGASQVREELIQSFRDAKDPTIASLGTRLVLGTPAYMAPEQARGERGDGRCDVYSLGAILFEVYSGAPPSVGVDSRNPLPPEVGAVVDRALHPDPRHRYASPAELKADLDRLRKGEPVLAGSSRPEPQVVERFSRRRAIWIGAAVSLLLGTGVMMLWAKLRKVGKGMPATAPAGPDDSLEEILALRRMGRKEESEKLEARYREHWRALAERSPDSAEPPFRLGRLRVLCLDFDGAMAELNRALEKNPEYAPARLERGLLRLREYEERVQELREDRRTLLEDSTLMGIGPGAGAESLLDAASENRRRLALEDLEGAPIPPAPAAVAWLRGNVAEARRLLIQFSRENGHRPETQELLGRMAREEGNFPEAVKKYTDGYERDRWYVPIVEGRGLAYFEEARRREKEGRDLTEFLSPAISDLTSVLHSRGEDSRIHLRIGLAYAAWADGDRRRLRQDPEDRARQAMRHFDRAVDLAKGDPGPLLVRAMIHRKEGRRAAQGNRDPSEFLARAIGDGESAERSAPSSWEPPLVLGLARMDAWTWRSSRATTPSEKEQAETLDREAVRDTQRAMSLAPTRIEPKLLMGTWHERRGRYRDALAAYEASLSLDPMLRLRLRDRMDSCRSRLEK